MKAARLLLRVPRPRPEAERARTSPGHIGGVASASRTWRGSILQWPAVASLVGWTPWPVCARFSCQSKPGSGSIFLVNHHS